MNPEMCYVRESTPLPTALQQRYDQLPAPQCTNLTYIYTFLIKLALFTSDATIRDIMCHLNKAVSNLQNIHVSMIIIWIHICVVYVQILFFQVDLTGSSCHIFSYTEYLQIYEQMEVFHFPVPISKYCILDSLNHESGIRTLLTNQGRGISMNLFPPCNLGLCSN